MNHLTAHDILNAWELGQRQHPLDRALTLLSIAHKDISRDKLAALSIGQRDALLVRLREQTFGSTMNGFTRCNQCNEALEFTLSTTDIVTHQGSGSITHEKSWEMAADDVKLRFRLPDSRDLMLIEAVNSVDEARRVLLECCLLSASRDGQVCAVDNLPEEIMDKVEVAMTEADPQANVQLDLSCPACQHSWLATFDIASFLWSEINAWAQHVLNEVHLLAKAYSWREADILAMSSARRRFYLERVMQ